MPALTPTGTLELADGSRTRLGEAHTMTSESIHIAASGFTADAHGWVDWLRAELVAGRWEVALSTVAPAVWRNDSGNEWRIVRTADGIEVRPELQSPFLQIGESPKVTALGLGRDTVAVELTCRTGRWVDRFPLDAFDIARLGHEMLDEKGLPHDNLRALFPLRT